MLRAFTKKNHRLSGESRNPGSAVLGSGKPSVKPNSVGNCQLDSSPGCMVFSAQQRQSSFVTSWLYGATWSRSRRRLDVLIEAE